jgi:hypothetical protein
LQPSSSGSLHVISFADAAAEQLMVLQRRQASALVYLGSGALGKPIILKDRDLQFENRRGAEGRTHFRWLGSLMLEGGVGHRLPRGNGRTWIFSDGGRMMAVKGTKGGCGIDRIARGAYQLTGDVPETRFARRIFRPSLVRSKILVGKREAAQIARLISIRLTANP